MSIATEIQRLKNAKASIKSSIEGKGVTVSDITKLDQYYAYIDNIVTPNLQEKTVNPQTSAQTIKPDSGYNGLSKVTVKAMPTATQATPIISVSSSGLITASATQSEGYVSAGTKSATQHLTTQERTTITPGTANTTISSGVYTTGTVTIKGDKNLVPENIKSGISIFGVTGNYSGSSSGSCTITGSTLLYVQGVSNLQLVEYDPTISGSMTVERNSIVTTISYSKISSVSSSCKILFSVQDSGTWRSAVYIGNVSSCSMS